MRRWTGVVRVLLATALVGATGLLAVPPAAAAPFCGIRWGSLPEEAVATSTAALVDVRAGRHRCYDRVVLDYAGRVDGYRVQYVPVVTQDGSGVVVPLEGGAKLQVSVDGPANDVETGAPSFAPDSDADVVDVDGFRTLRQVAWGGSFEGTSLLGLGARARLPFRVLVLDGPGSGSRVVVDVAHRW